MGRAQFSLDEPEPSEQVLVALHGWKKTPSTTRQGHFTFANDVTGERIASSDADWRPPPGVYKLLSKSKPGFYMYKSTITGKRAHSEDSNYPAEVIAKITFVAKPTDLRLDEASEKAIEPLGENEEVVVLMPGKEFIIVDGPKRTVLYWLCRDAAMTEMINGFLEGERGPFLHHHCTHVSIVHCRPYSHHKSTGSDVKAICAYLTLLGTLVSISAMTETVDVVPYELVWFAILAVPDSLREFFKLNTEAVTLILRELDFWVPFVTLCLGLLCASASFGHDGAANVLFITAALNYTVFILFGKPVHAAREYSFI